MDSEGHLEATQGTGRARRAGACPRGGGQKHHSGGHAEFKSGVVNASVSRGPGRQTNETSVSIWEARRRWLGQSQQCISKQLPSPHQQRNRL